MLQASFSSSLFRPGAFSAPNYYLAFQFFLISTNTVMSVLPLAEAFSSSLFRHKVQKYVNSLHSFQFFLISTWDVVVVGVMVGLSVLPYFDYLLLCLLKLKNPFSSSLFRLGLHIFPLLLLAFSSSLFRPSDICFSPTTKFFQFFLISTW